MDRQDYLILEEMIETIDRFKRHGGQSARRDHRSSLQKLRKELSDFTGKCQRKELKGRARKRKSGELFLKIVAQFPVGEGK